MAKTKKSNLRPLLIIFGLAVLTLGLILVTNMVQKNQENRANASVGMDIFRGVCKELLCKANVLTIIKNQDCRNACDKMVFRFDCGMLTKVDNVRNSACFGECKIATTVVSQIIGKSADTVCTSFCTTVVNLPGRTLGCTDDPCLNLKGECSAPLSSSAGANCNLKSGKPGKVVANKCLSKESASKRCCVPNAVTPTPTKTTCSGKYPGSVCRNPSDCVSSRYNGVIKGSADNCNGSSTLCCSK
jgi:hypothetical protein